MYTIQTHALGMSKHVQRKAENIVDCISVALDLEGKNYIALGTVYFIEIKSTDKSKSVLGRQEPERIGVKK